jgi:hypothetical protein
MANGPYFQDPVLTQISQDYKNAPGTFLAEQIFPIVNVDKKTGVYFQYGKESLRKPVSTLRTGHAATPVFEYSTLKVPYGPLAEHDLKVGITRDEYLMYDDPLNPETDAVNNLNQAMQIEKEINLSAVMSNTSVITQNTNLGTVPTSQWNDYGNSNPFNDIQLGITQMITNGLTAPNSIFMGYQVWAQLVNHPDLLDRVKWSAKGVMTTDLLASLFSTAGITNVWVGQAVYNSAAEGLTATNGFAWGKNFWLGYVTTTPGLRTLNGGYTLTIANGKYVDRWDEADGKVSWIRNNDYYQQFVVGAEAFYLIQNAVA